MRIILTLLILLLTALPAMALDVTVSVSSVKVDFGLPYAPDNLLDGDTETAWVSGGIGPGTGQWIDLDFALPVRVYRIGVFNGYQHENLFKEYRRIRSGRVIYPDGSETHFWLRDEPGEQFIELKSGAYKKLRIAIDEVFPEGETTAKIKLAVSELKLYISLMANPDGTERTAEEVDHISAPPSEAGAHKVPDAIVEMLREFYVRHTSLAPDYAELFAEKVRNKNDFRFEVFQSIQRQRGTFDILRTAQVDTSGLGFEMVHGDDSLAEVRVFGAYHVKVGRLDTYLEEDSIFVVTRETDGWKILELDGEEEW